MVTKKYGGKKKYTRKKKIPLNTKRSEWVRKKKIQPEKKNTADQQKEWVSGSTIFSREKKTETFGPNSFKKNNLEFFLKLI